MWWTSQTTPSAPKYRVSKLQSRRIEDRIDIYEDRIREWLLHPARWLLENVPHSEIAALILCLSYVEGWEQYRSGEDSKNQSRVFFRRGLLQVFTDFDFDAVPQITAAEEIICDALYEQLRCGMAHDGMLRHKVFIMNNARAPITVAAPQATGIDGGISAIVVNPALILNGIEHHFERYVTHLRNPESRQLRDNFTRTWERPNAEMLV